MITKEKFVEYMEFIERKDAQEHLFMETLETLCPGNYCDAFIYAEYEDKLISLLQNMLNDINDLITYRLYEYPMLTEEEKADQVKETPEVESWETVYEYLLQGANDENIK
jgi:hypothetical protein